MPRSVAIVLLCVVAAIVYGIVHDQVTARICIEYFTVGHPPVFGTDDPTLLGLGWGVLATWWVGLLLGVALALAARAGSRPKLAPSQLVRPITIMLALVGTFALLAGVVGQRAAQRGWVRLLEPLASRVPPHKHVAFLTDLWAHSASYAGGFVGGAALCAWVLKRRRRDALMASRSDSTLPDARRQPESQYLVTVDESRIVCHLPSGKEEAVRWDELDAVVIETNDSGPLGMDVLWLLVGRGGRSGCVVPQGATGERELFEAIQRLPGFDNAQVIDAMGCTENRKFLCWQRAADGSPAEPARTEGVVRRQ